MTGTPFWGDSASVLVDNSNLLIEGMKMSLLAFSFRTGGACLMQPGVKDTHPGLSFGKAFGVAMVAFFVSASLMSWFVRLRLSASDSLPMLESVLGEQPLTVIGKGVRAGIRVLLGAVRDC